jgi:vitamin B12 transporter
VHGYLRGWGNFGAREFQLRIPATHLHTLALTYLFPLRDARLGGSLEAQNLTNERLYGSYGAQLPGRAFYLKLDFQR